MSACIPLLRSSIYECAKETSAPINKAADLLAPLDGYHTNLP